MPRERFKDDISIDLTGTQSKHALAAHPIQRFDDDIFVRVIKLVQMGHLAADQSRCCKLGKLKNREFLDRKSTRLNSSHVAISYAVFCLKKKNNNKDDE